MTRNKLELIILLAEAQNAFLRSLVDRVATILDDHDLASDLIYGVTSLEQAVSVQRKQR
jgi:hypothetical protein